MIQRVSRLMGLTSLLVSTAGCALLLVGAGAAGGYAISKDSVRNQFDLPKETVFRHSAAVAKEMGLVTLEDSARGQLHVKIQDANVVITVKPLTRRTVELKVKARNSLLMPEIETAQAVYNKIVERL